MTALTIGSFHVVCKQTDLLGKTLPNQESVWVSHFPSLCIIDLILCDLIISRLFVLEEFVYDPGLALGLPPVVVPLGELGGVNPPVVLVHFFGWRGLTPRSTRWFTGADGLGGLTPPTR